MSIRHLLLTSVLVAAFGCSGDDSGDDGNDTGANTGTGTMTTAMTTMSTMTTAMTTMDMDTVGMDTVGMDTEGTDTVGMDTEGTDTVNADSSGSGSGSDSGSGSGSSGSGGEVSAECMTFCEGYFDTCGDNAGNDYVDVDGCHTACADFDQGGMTCRETHLGLAEGDADTHCPHASNDGGGVC